jgi:glycogen debranching enzyme
MTLASDAMYSGWGLRTLAKGESRYNPMSYHNGSIWPHDNAIVAMGLKQYGCSSLALLFMLLRAALGLHIDGVRHQVTFTDPSMPPWLRWIRIENLRVNSAVVDLLCERHPHDVGISVIRRQGDVRVVHLT